MWPILRRIVAIPRVREHADDSAGAGGASVAGSSDGGGPPCAIATEVAAREPVRTVRPEHARAPSAGAGAVVPLRYFAEISGFARLMPLRLSVGAYWHAEFRSLPDRRYGR